MNKIEFKYNENQKYNNICKTYLSYYVDPINKILKQINFNKFNALECSNYPNAIYTIDWDYKIDSDFNKLKENYNPNYFINFSTNKFDNQILDQNIEFKENYKFMNLELSNQTKYEFDRKINFKIQRVTNNEQLNHFLKIVDELEANLVTDKNKFIGLLELQDICHMYLVIVNGKPAGTGSVFLNENNFAVIDDINIREEFRRKGLARNLMKQLINDCIDKDIKDVSLFASEMGMSVYQKLNFKEEEFYLEQFKIIY